MDYKKLYDSIIRNSKDKEITREKLKLEGDYFERHHIIPESSGGSNSNENLVLLTAREHYICHWLLYKINPTKENAFSWWMMSNSDGNIYHIERKRQSSRKYEYARNAFSAHISVIHKGKNLSKDHKQKLSASKLGEKNPMSGKKHSEEHKAYLSKINLGENNHFYGKTHDEETRKKISDAAKKRVGEKSNRYGKSHSEETKQKFSQMYKGKTRLIPHEIVECPHCKKQGIKPNMKRWHFENCKEKPNE
jgi:hypothetical protein